MKEVTVNKSDLLIILTKNRAQHQIDYDKAIEGYYVELVEKLEKALVIAKEGPDGDQPVRGVHLQEPLCYITEYDRAIGMLEMHVENEVTISGVEYSHFVDDEWVWKDNWKLTNTGYMSKVGS